jgi:hypothetical protein
MYANVFLNNVGGMPSKRYFNPRYVYTMNLKYLAVEICNFMVFRSFQRNYHSKCICVVQV